MTKPSIDALEAQLAATPPEQGLAHIDALNALAWALRFEETERAHAMATEARARSQAQHYALGEARALRTIGMTITDMDSLHRVFEIAEEAKRLFDVAGDPAGRAASRDFLASIYEHVGDYSTGLQLALDALTIARELGDPIRQGYALSSVGGILAAAGENEAAVGHLEEALALFEGQGDDAGATTICNRLSKVLRGLGRNADSLAYAVRVREVAEANNDETVRLMALGVMAEIAADEGRLDEAVARYRDALDEAWVDEPVRTLLGTSLQVEMGKVLLELDRVDEAERELEDALRRSEGESVSIIAEASAQEALATLRERQGRPAEALTHFRRGQTLRQQIAAREARDKLALVEARAATEAARKEAELQRLRYAELHSMQAKLVEAEKMALLGKLAAGTAHEINTPLAVLRSNIELIGKGSARLAERLREGADATAQIERLAALIESSSATMHDAMQRIADIARSFGRFSRLDQAERQAFDVREGLESAISLLEPTVSRDIRWQRRFDDDLPRVAAWPRELNHAFFTVLRNAAEAIEGEGHVTVEARAGDGEVIVRVADSGRGMDETLAQALFDVAWSHSGDRTSMRLGLSAAYATMQKHGGAIEVDSREREGTTVTFRLPIV